MQNPKHGQVIFDDGCQFVNEWKRISESGYAISVLESCVAQCLVGYEPHSSNSVPIAHLMVLGYDGSEKRDPAGCIVRMITTLGNPGMYVVQC